MAPLAYVEHGFFIRLSLHLTTLCTPALGAALLFIVGPSEPPRLIIVFIIARVPSDPSPPFQLAAAGGKKKKPQG